MANKDDNTIYVGGKGFFNYIMACKKQLEKNDEISIKARGKHTSRAIDILEYLKREEDLKCKFLETGTEEFDGDEGDTVFVSTIEIIAEK